MNIFFFIGRLSVGGAERQLCELAKGLAHRGHNITVVTIYPSEFYTEEIRQISSVRLRSLWSFKGANVLLRMWQLLGAPILLRRLMKDTDCIYSMLETTNFIAWLATIFSVKPELIWGVRSSNMEGHWKMAFFEKLCALVSPTVGLVIANSQSGLKYLLKEGRGYHPKRSTVIFNGIDTDKFQYNAEGRRVVRIDAGIQEDELVVGIVARLDPMKDHPTFLKAAVLVVKKIQNVRFVCVGDGPAEYAGTLRALSRELGLEDHVIWLGERKDMPAVYSSFDLLVSSSAYGEGFSNVIGEAMACDVPCVATNVGDSASIVSNIGGVVPAGDEYAISKAILNALNQLNNGKIMKGRSRQHIVDNFSIKSLIEKTELVLSKQAI